MLCGLPSISSLPVSYVKERSCHAYNTCEAIARNGVGCSTDDHFRHGCDTPVRSKLVGVRTGPKMLVESNAVRLESHKLFGER